MKQEFVWSSSYTYKNGKIFYLYKKQENSMLQIEYLSKDGKFLTHPYLFNSKRYLFKVFNIIAKNIRIVKSYDDYSQELVADLKI